MKLLPKDHEFFDLFQQQGHLIMEAAKLLHEGVETPGTDWEQFARRMYQLENRGDEVRHNILRRLHQVFITPLDPEDIHHLSSHLDDALDSIDALAARFHIFRVGELPAPVHKLTDILITSSEACSSALNGLSRGHEIGDLVIRMHDLEDEADKIYHNALIELFADSHPPIELMKLKEIYEMLEEAADSFESVSHSLEEITLKND
jgi:predicted phosphate transport protein (TIGR00153 family)